MIEFKSGKYRAHRDRMNWNLEERYESKTKTGELVEKWRTTYHPTIKQVCEAILDREAGECKSATEVKELFINAVNIIDAEVEK